MTRRSDGATQDRRICWIDVGQPACRLTAGRPDERFNNGIDERTVSWVDKLPDRQTDRRLDGRRADGTSAWQPVGTAGGRRAMDSWETAGRR